MAGKQKPLQRGNWCRVNIGDSAYFGRGKREWVDATVDAIHTSGNGRHYDVTVVADGSKHYSIPGIDVKKRRPPPVEDLTDAEIRHFGPRFEGDPPGWKKR